MERLHANREQKFPPMPEFRASSIEDMLSITSKMQAIEGWYEEYNRLKRSLGFKTRLEIFFNGQIGHPKEFPERWWAVSEVRLPTVWHTPQLDGKLKKDKIVIFDSTKDCEVILMKRKHADYDPKKLKESTWCSSVVLLNRYNETGGDYRYLIEIGDQDDREDSTAPINSSDLYIRR